MVGDVGGGAGVAQLAPRVGALRLAPGELAIEKERCARPQPRVACDDHVVTTRRRPGGDSGAGREIERAVRPMRRDESADPRVVPHVVRRAPDENSPAPKPRRRCPPRPLRLTRRHGPAARSRPRLHRPSLPVSFPPATGSAMRRVYTRPSGDVKNVGALEEERPLLGIEQRVALVDVDLDRVGLDLAVVGIASSRSRSASVVIG